MLDWDTLRFVLAVAREGTFMGAARSLDVSVSTVSRQLDRAEEELKAKLFDRRHKGLFPTPQGEIAIGIAEDVEKRMTSLYQRVEGTNEAETGLICLSLPLNVMPYGLVDDIREFQGHHPDITFEIHTTDETVDFANREADVVMRVAENPPPSLWGFRIATVGLSFYGSRDFVAEWGVRMHDVPQTVPVPYMTHLTSNPQADSDEFKSRFPSARLVAQCNGLDSLIPMVNGGIGAGRMMRYMARCYPNLIKLFDCDERWSRSVWILTHRDFRETRRIRLFMEFVRDCFEARMNDF